jgi:hypothetical protein
MVVYIQKRQLYYYTLLASEFLGGQTVNHIPKENPISRA